MKRGLVLGLVQIVLVLTITAKYAWERAHYPRAWAPVLPVDPDLPLRGRYLSLRIMVNPAGNGQQQGFVRCRLTVENGRLVAHPDSHGAAMVSYFHDHWVLDKPLAFFIPEHAPDPTRDLRGRQLFALITVPPQAAPRPIQLAVASGGRLAPLQ
jgi:hypothetical protein